MLRGLTAENVFDFHANRNSAPTNVPMHAHSQSTATSLDRSQAQQQNEEAARQDALLDEMAAEMMDQ